MQSVTIVITSDCLRPRTHKLRSEMIELVLLQQKLSTVKDLFMGQWGAHGN